MNFDPTETQRLVREMARTFAEKEVRPESAAIDREDVFPRGLYRRMADLGLLGMTLPAEQRPRFIPAIARGKKICLIAQTEPGAGSDVVVAAATHIMKVVA